MALEALNSPTTATPPFPFEDGDYHYLDPCVKRKRSKRQRMENPPTEEEYLALCLIMLARGGATGGRHKSPPPSPIPNLSYKCPICNKGFSSPQALGGHKASHRKLPGEDDQSSSTTAHGGFPANLPSSLRTHECSVCQRTFSSGQALGGHKRRHFERGGVASSELGRGFDLNLPALQEFQSQLSGDEEVESPLPVKQHLDVP